MSTVAAPTRISLLKRIMEMIVHTSCITQHINFQKCMLMFLLQCGILVHAIYINEWFSKLLLELVFTGHTVPVVQVRYYHSVGLPKGTVVVQYPQW